MMIEQTSRPTPALADQGNTLSADNPGSPGIDWNLLAEIFPALVNAVGWLVWFGYLLVPSLFGLHNVDLFSTANNAVFTLMGFILCLAINVAIRSEHGGRAVFFVCGLALLAYWF